MAAAVAARIVGRMISSLVRALAHEIILPYYWAKTPMNMIRDLKNMIARCIGQMRQGACADCASRDSCAFGWADRFGMPAGHGAATMKRPRAANPLMDLLGEMARAFEPKPKPRRSDFQQAVSRQIELLLAGGNVRIDQVARALGYSRQTLYRRLKEEGVTFEQLLDRLRHRLALRLMREGLPVKEATYRLGFSDPAAFSRAFKRWTGTSPRDMRGRGPGRDQDG
jgi:AraC-like DNA-binding protein